MPSRKSSEGKYHITKSPAGSVARGRAPEGNTVDFTAVSAHKELIVRINHLSSGKEPSLTPDRGRRTQRTAHLHTRNTVDPINSRSCLTLTF